MDNRSSLHILSTRSFLREADEPSTAAVATVAAAKKRQEQQLDENTPDYDKEVVTPSQEQSNPPKMMNTRLRSRTKSAGRPRIDAGSPAVLSEDRRTQVRRAQKTYRIKKEAVFRDTLARVTDLEEKLRRLSEEAVGAYQVATEARLQLSHPDVYARLKRIHGLIETDGSRGSSPQPVSSSPMDVAPDAAASSVAPPQTFGHRLDERESSSAEIEMWNPLPMSPPISTKSHTYAFQEVRFSRRLQRYCLEHAFNLFTDPRSNPAQIYRMFRLVPCVQDKDKTQPRFEKLLRGDHQSPLEIPSLPFYGVGGAGTHYPDEDEMGNTIYPGNMRMPRRVLGILPRAELGGGNGDRLLEICGLGGEWFDSRDVEGYLRVQGLDVQESGLFPTIRISRRLAAEMHSRDRSYVLDVESFFWRLFHGLVILGRAPGFRMKDVTAAFHASLRPSGKA